MAISTAKTYLMYKGKDGTSADYEMLCPITNYPDMGSTPSKLDTTDLSAEKFKTSILGLQEAPDLTFEANYDKTLFTKINGLSGKTYAFELQFGAGGAEGKFDWDGQVVAYVTGGGVDEVRKMTIVVSAETEITPA